MCHHLWLKKDKDFHKVAQAHNTWNMIAALGALWIRHLIGTICIPSSQTAQLNNPGE